MERFDADVGSSDAALQKAPIVFESVGVDVPTNVGFSMVNHVVDVFGVQTLVSNPSITEHLRTRLNVFAYFGLQSFSLNVRNYRGSDFPMTATLPIPPVPLIFCLRLLMCIFRANPPM